MADAEPWREHLPLAHRLADASGAVILHYFRQALAIEDKEYIDGYSPVTVADREAEAAIRALIEEACPDHGILGEEHGHERPDARFTWVIDPIDGTKAFISGMTTWGTLIALQDRGTGIIGVLDQPFLGERFVGHGEGAWLGERKLATRACPELSGATLYATEPDMFSPTERAAFDALAARVRLRRFGADCYAYGMLAAGFIDLVVEASMNLWDIAALIPIVEGAGGIVTGWDGAPMGADGRTLAVGDPRLHAPALEILAQAASPENR
ncbi:MAG: histidinol-phosphatase [Rhodospirillales bacterium]|nr:histidinol-phosphatase [Rhodospirillales bacterium]